jgi:DMSO/TMAO reductase YedYZ molybdopterin-dependent catalytic subunit
MITATIVMGGLRALVDVQTLPELLSDTIIYLIPPRVFSALIDALRFDAKPLLLLGLVVGQICVGSLGGLIIASRVVATEPFTGMRQTLRPALVLSAVAWAITMCVVLPVISAGFLGADTSAGPTVTSAGYFVVWATYGFVLAWAYPRLGAAAARREGRGVTRREVVRQLGVGLLGVAVAGIGLRVVANATREPDEPEALPSAITPTEKFYVVGKNLIGVNVDVGRWSLSVSGSGSRVGQLTLADLKALPRAEIVSTLTCISNLIGGDLIGTARWTGVALRDVIGTPTEAEGIRNVVFTGWDDYSDSIPIDKALDPSTLLAYEMDGEPLRAEHGYPLRLIVPGRYGIKNVKWIKRIEIISHGYVGFWQDRGWTDTALIQSQSQIDVPRDGSTHPVGPVSVGGIAFAGDRGISRVELSVDGARTWSPATLLPPLSPYTWTTWIGVWSPAVPGLYGLVVRATDGTGATQGSAESAPIPDGSTGYHRINVRIR